METAATTPLRRQLKAWVGLARIPFHSVGVLPFLLGIVLAWYQGHQIRLGLALTSTLAVILIMLTTYLSGEYFDFETDSINREYNKFSGGSRVLQSGVVSRKAVLLAANVCLGLSGALGLFIYLFFKTGPFTLVLGAFGAICGYFYTTSPARWAYRGIGEVLIGICYGWLTVNTAYYLQTSRFDLTASLISLPIATSIFLVILINEFPDYASDKISGKRNLVVRFGHEKMASVAFWTLVATYLLILLSLSSGLPRAWTALFSLIPLALVVSNAVPIAKKAYENRKALEGICARMILLNLSIALMYMAAFAVQKWVSA